MTHPFRLPDDPLLLATLRLAVPLAMREIAHLTQTQRHELAQRGVDLLTAHGDDLLYGGRHCAPTFAALAKALAACAFQPGGITLAQAHWCTQPHLDCPTPGAARTHARLCGLDPTQPQGAER